MLRDYVYQGAKGFGEHKAGLKIDHPKMCALYEVCDDLRLPVLFHMDEQRGIDAPGLPGLESVLKSFPKVEFIGHGPGFWASISGELTAADMAGYPADRSGPAEHLIDCSTLTAISGVTSRRGLVPEPSHAIASSRRTFLVRRADRLLFGTDYLKPGQDVPQFRLLAEIELPPPVRARIERGNAAKLLGLTL